MLAVEGVSAGYGRLKSCKGVARVGPGEIVGIIGPNGAGKSTLLKTIFGYLPPFEEVSASPATRWLAFPDRVMRQGIGYVAQAGSVFADMSVHENLVLGGCSLGSRRARWRHRARLRAVPAVPHPRPPARRQPVRRRTARARRRRTLVVKPRLIILDEPSAALAPRFIDEIYATLAALNRSGIALLIVEQNVRRILDAAHRVVVLDMGRNAFAGASAALRQSDRIRRLYLGEDAG
jgi:branched-chain amino acid transport system ATP-binding protein/neutral amino acid transport system ATP-binding protein